MQIVNMRVPVDEYDRATLQRLPELTNPSLDIVTNAMLKAHDGTPSWQLHNWYGANRDSLLSSIRPTMDAWAERTEMRLQRDEMEAAARQTANSLRTLVIGIPLVVGVVALGWWLAK